MKSLRKPLKLQRSTIIGKTRYGSLQVPKKVHFTFLFLSLRHTPMAFNGEVHAFGTCTNTHIYYYCNSHNWNCTENLIYAWICALAPDIRVCVCMHVPRRDFSRCSALKRKTLSSHRMYTHTHTHSFFLFFNIYCESSFFHFVFMLFSWNIKTIFIHSPPSPALSPGLCALFSTL